MRAVNLYSKLTLRETPMLFLEFHGTEAGVAEQSERFGEIAAEFGGGPFEWTTRPEERTRLWEARHNAALSTFTLRPGSQMIPTDVCVPISRLAECVTETQRDIAESKLIAPIVGHVGDGNFHLTLLIDRDDPTRSSVAKAFNERLVERALAMDGTCTGEHGVGQGKMKYLLAEHGAPALEAMRAIKRALDPLDIMNPGKIRFFSFLAFPHRVWTGSPPRCEAFGRPCSKLADTNSPPNRAHWESRGSIGRGSGPPVLL